MNNQKTDYIKSKFHPAIRIVAAILVVTFFFQDIAWAYPDDFRNLAITGLQNKAVRARLKAALIIELIEKRSALKDSLSNLKLDDILKWNRSTEKEFKDVAFKPIRDNGELKEVRLSINDGSEDIIISYFDSSYRHPEIIPAGYMDITDQITNPAVISANSLIQRQVLKATSLLPPPEGPAPAAPRQGKSFSGDRLSSAGLIAGIGLRPDAANREVDAALLEIADNADANAKLLKILGFTKKQLPILVKAMAETKPDLFGSKLNTAADLDSVPAIGPATIKAARDKIRLGAACCSKYKEAFANFIAMAYAINRKDTEDEVRSKIDKIFAESRHLLSNKEFIKDMSAYFEHDPDILLSLTYIIWAEIRAGPADYRRLFLVDKLRELAAGTDGAPLSYYRLAAMRYIAPWDRKKNALAIFVRLSIEFPEPGEFYDAIYKTLVELAMHGDLSVFYAFSQPNQRPKLAMLAVKAVAEARRGTDDLKKFLDAAKRHPDRKVQDTVKAAELSQPILPVIIAFPVIKGIPHPELLEKINPAKAKIIKNHLQLPDADLFLGRIMPSGVGKILRKGAEEYFDDGYVYGYIACLKAMRLWGDAVMTEDAGRSIFLPVYEAVANMHKHGGLGATIDIKMSEEDVLEVICDSEDPGHILKPEEMSAKTVLAHECVMESAGKKWERAAGGALKSGPSDKASGVRVTLRWRKPGVEALEVPAIEGPGAQNMAKARPSSDWRGDWVNPYIIEYIDEGRAVEIDEDGEKVKIIRRGGPNSRDGPAERALEGRFKSTGLFRKIEEAKDPARLRKILDAYPNFKPLSKKQKQKLIGRIVRNVRLSVILGSAYVVDSETDEVFMHMRTGLGRRYGFHDLSPTIWIGELLLERLSADALARLLLEECQHILKAPWNVSGRWIHVDEPKGWKGSPKAMIKHDPRFADYLTGLARACRPLFDACRPGGQNMGGEKDAPRDADGLSKYIDELKGQEPLSGVLAIPARYEAKFFEPLRELLFTRLASDFENVEGFIGICRDILARRYGPSELRGAMDNAHPELLEALYRIKRRKGAQNASIGFYGFLFYCLTKNPKPYLLPIYDVLVPPGSFKEIAIGKKGISYHTRRDSVVHVYDKKIIYEGRDAYYRKQMRLRYEEKEPGRDIPSENHQKILRAVEAWRERYPEREGRIKKFEDAATVLEMEEMLTHLIFSDPENKVVCPMHAGRHRHALYFSKKYLDGLDINDPEHMAELAFWLNFGQKFLDVNDNMSSAGIDPDKINRALSQIAANYLNMENPIADPLKMKERLADYMRMDALVCYKEVLNRVISLGSVIDLCIDTREHLRLLTREDVKEYAGRIDPVRRVNLVNRYGEYKNDCRHLLYRCEGMGLCKWADRAYTGMAAATDAVQVYDPGGFKPVDFQVDLVFTALRFGRFKRGDRYEFLEELETLLTGRGYPRNLRRGELERLRDTVLTPKCVKSPDGKKSFVQPHSFENELTVALAAQLDVEQDPVVRDYVQDDADRLLRYYFDDVDTRLFRGLEPEFIDEDENCNYRDAVLDENGRIDGDPNFNLGSGFANKKARLIAVDNDWNKGFGVFYGLDKIAEFAASGAQNMGKLTGAIPQGDAPQPPAAEPLAAPVQQTKDEQRTTNNENAPAAAEQPDTKTPPNQEMLDDIKNAGFGKPYFATGKPEGDRVSSNRTSAKTTEPPTGVAPNVPSPSTAGIRPQADISKKTLEVLEEQINPRAPPTLVEIEITNYCNLMCSICHRGNDDYQQQPRHDMAFDEFKKIIDAYDYPIDRIQFSGTCEPTANPDLVKMIKYVAETKKPTKIELITNATLLTQELGRELIAAGLTELRASIDGSTDEAYYPIRYQELAPVIKNIKQFTESVKEAGKAGEISTWIACVITKYNFDDIINMPNFAHDLGADTLELRIFETNLEHVKRMAVYDKIRLISLREKVEMESKKWGINCISWDIDNRTNADCNLETEVHINNLGYFSPCYHLPEINLSQRLGLRPFSQDWNSPEVLKLLNKIRNDYWLPECSCFAAISARNRPEAAFIQIQSLLSQTHPILNGASPAAAADEIARVSPSGMAPEAEARSRFARRTKLLGMFGMTQDGKETDNGLNDDDVLIATGRIQRGQDQLPPIPRQLTQPLKTYYSLPSFLRGGQTIMPKIINAIKIKTQSIRTNTENFIKNSDANIAAKRILAKLRHILNMPSRLPSLNIIIGFPFKGSLSYAVRAVKGVALTQGIPLQETPPAAENQTASPATAPAALARRSPQGEGGAESPLASPGTVHTEADNGEPPAAEPERNNSTEFRLGEEGTVYDWFALGAISLAGLIAFYTSSSFAAVLFAVITASFISDKIGPIHFDVLKNFVKKALGDILALVKRHHGASSIRVSEKDMTSALSYGNKTKPFEDFDNNRRFEGSKPHLDISISWSPTKRSLGTFFSTSMQSRTASLILLSSFVIVLACVWQPFSDVAVAINIPSSSCSITIGNSYLRILDLLLSNIYSLLIPFSQADKTFLFLPVIIAAAFGNKPGSEEDKITPTPPSAEPLNHSPLRGSGSGQTPALSEAFSPNDAPQLLPPSNFARQSFIIDAATGDRGKVLIKEPPHEQGKIVLHDANYGRIAHFTYRRNVYNKRVSLMIAELNVEFIHRREYDERILKYAGVRLMQSAAILSKELGFAGAVNLTSDKSDINAQSFYESLEKFGLRKDSDRVEHRVYWYLEPEDADNFIKGIDDYISAGVIPAVKPAIQSSAPAAAVPQEAGKTEPSPLSLSGTEPSPLSTGDAASGGAAAGITPSDTVPEIGKLILNSKQTTMTQAKEEMVKLIDEGIVFNAFLTDDILELGVSPIVIANKQIHHQDIHCPSLAEGVFRCYITMRPEVTIIPTMQPREYSPQEKMVISDNMIKLCRFLICLGIPHDINLEWATRDIFKNMRAVALGPLRIYADDDTKIKTVADLAGRPLSNVIQKQKGNESAAPSAPNSGPNSGDTIPDSANRSSSPSLDNGGEEEKTKPSPLSTLFTSAAEDEKMGVTPLSTISLEQPFIFNAASIEQRQYKVEQPQSAVYPIIEISINDKRYKVGNGYFLIITLASGKKIYWGGQHNLSYSFAFEHYGKTMQDIIDKGGVVWRHLDAHGDFGAYMGKKQNPKQGIDWKEEVRFGYSNLNSGDYLGYLATTGIANRLDTAHSLDTLDHTTARIPLRHVSIPEKDHDLAELAAMEIDGGVTDLDIDIVVGLNPGMKDPEARERFEAMKPYIVSVAGRSEACFITNSSELNRDNIGVPTHIDPKQAALFNGKIIEELSAQASAARPKAATAAVEPKDKGPRLRSPRGARLSAKPREATGREAGPTKPDQETLDDINNAGFGKPYFASGWVGDGRLSPDRMASGTRPQAEKPEPSSLPLLIQLREGDLIYNRKSNSIRKVFSAEEKMAFSKVDVLRGRIIPRDRVNMEMLCRSIERGESLIFREKAVIVDTETGTRRRIKEIVKENTGELLLEVLDDEGRAVKEVAADISILAQRVAKGRMKFETASVENVAEKEPQKGPPAFVPGKGVVDIDGQEIDVRNYIRTNRPRFRKEEPARADTCFGLLRDRLNEHYRPKGYTFNSIPNDIDTARACHVELGQGIAMVIAPRKSEPATFLEVFIKDREAIGYGMSNIDSRGDVIVSFQVFPQYRSGRADVDRKKLYLGRLSALCGLFEKPKYFCVHSRQLSFTEIEAPSNAAIFYLKLGFVPLDQKTQELVKGLSEKERLTQEEIEEIAHSVQTAEKGKDFLVLNIGEMGDIADISIEKIRNDRRRNDPEGATPQEQAPPDSDSNIRDGSGLARFEEALAKAAAETSPSQPAATQKVTSEGTIPQDTTGEQEKTVSVPIFDFMKDKIVVKRNNIPKKTPGQVAITVREISELNEKEASDIAGGLRRWLEYKDPKPEHGTYLEEWIEELESGYYGRNRQRKHGTVPRLYFAVSLPKINGGDKIEVEAIVEVQDHSDGTWVTCWEIRPDNRRKSQSRFIGAGRQLLFYVINRELKNGKDGLLFDLAADAELAKEGIKADIFIDREELGSIIAIRNWNTFRMLEDAAKEGDEGAKQILTELGKNRDSDRFPPPAASSPASFEKSPAGKPAENVKSKDPTPTGTDKEKREHSHIAKVTEGEEKIICGGNVGIKRFAGNRLAVGIFDTPKTFAFALFRSALQHYLNSVAGAYSAGLLVNVERIEIWRNLTSAGDFYLGTIRLDEGLFEKDSQALLKEVLWHEMVTSLARLVVPNPGLREAVATAKSLFHFCRPREEGRREGEYQREALRALESGRYSLEPKLLERYQKRAVPFHIQAVRALLREIMEGIAGQSRYAQERRALNKLEADPVKEAEAALTKTEILFAYSDILLYCWQRLNNWPYVLRANEALCKGEEWQIRPSLYQLIGDAFMALHRPLSGNANAFLNIREALISLIMLKESQLIERIKRFLSREELRDINAFFDALLEGPRTRITLTPAYQRGMKKLLGLFRRQKIPQREALLRLRFMAEKALTLRNNQARPEAAHAGKRRIERQPDKRRKLPAPTNIRPISTKDETEDVLKNLQDRASRMAEEERRNDAALQNREDVFSYLEFLAEQSVSPLALNRPIAIKKVHQRLQDFLRYHNGFRESVFIKTLSDIFGPKAAGKETIVIAGLIQAFLAKYISEAESLASLLEPVEIDALHRQFNRLYQFKFSRKAFRNLLLAAYPEKHFSGKEPMGKARICDTLNFNELWREASQDKKAQEKAFDEDELIIARIINQHLPSIGGSKEEKVRRILLSVRKDRTGENDKAAAEALSPYAKGKSSKAIAERMVALARGKGQSGRFSPGSGLGFVYSRFGDRIGPAKSVFGMFSPFLGNFFVDQSGGTAAPKGEPASGSGAVRGEKIEPSPSMPTSGISQEFLDSLEAMTLAQRLRAIRLYRAASGDPKFSKFKARNALARAAGIAGTTLLHMEAKADIENLPHPKNLFAAATALEVDPSYILMGLPLEHALSRLDSHGKRIEFLRARLGLTQKELASELLKRGAPFRSKDPKILRATIAQWEREVLPLPQFRRILAEFFRLNESQVFPGRKTERPSAEDAKPAKAVTAGKTKEPPFSVFPPEIARERYKDYAADLATVDLAKILQAIAEDEDWSLLQAIVKELRDKKAPLSREAERAVKNAEVTVAQAAAAQAERMRRWEEETRRKAEEAEAKRQAGERAMEKAKAIIAEARELLPAAVNPDDCGEILRGFNMDLAGMEIEKLPAELRLDIDKLRAEIEARRKGLAAEKEKNKKAKRVKTQSADVDELERLVKKAEGNIPLSIFKRLSELAAAVKDGNIKQAQELWTGLIAPLADMLGRQGRQDKAQRYIMPIVEKLKMLGVIKSATAPRGPPRSAKRTGDEQSPKDDISPNKGATGFGKDPLKVYRGDELDKHPSGVKTAPAELSGMLGVTWDSQEPDNQDENSNTYENNRQAGHGQSSSLASNVATTKVEINDISPYTKTLPQNDEPGINCVSTTAPNISLPISNSALPNSDLCDLPNRNLTIDDSLPQDIASVKAIAPGGSPEPLAASLDLVRLRSPRVARDESRLEFGARASAAGGAGTATQIGGLELATDTNIAAPAETNDERRKTNDGNAPAAPGAQNMGEEIKPEDRMPKKPKAERYEPSVKGKKKTGVSRWVLFDQFAAKLQDLPDEVVNRLKKETSFGEMKQILIEAGLGMVEELDGKFVITELEKFLRQRSARVSALPRPGRNILEYTGRGRHLIAYAADDFEFIVKAPREPEDMDKVGWISRSWIGNGCKTAKEKLGGLAVPTMIIDATDGSKKPFSYRLEKSGVQKTGLAIIQRKVIPVFDRLKYLAKEGKLSEAKTLLVQYKEFVISMFRRGVMDFDFNYRYGNCGIDPADEKIYLFDFGDLDEDAGNIGMFFEQLSVGNKYFYDDLKEQANKELADYWRSIYLEADDFFTASGESLFGIDLAPEKIESFRMKFPYDEKQIRSLFMDHNVGQASAGGSAASKVRTTIEEGPPRNIGGRNAPGAQNMGEEIKPEGAELAAQEPEKMGHPFVGQTPSADDVIRSMISKADKLFTNGIAARPFQEGVEILLSESLFDSEDKNHLVENILASNKFIKVVSFDEIRHAATRERSRGKVACVVTDSEFEILRNTNHLDDNKDALKAAILKLDNPLTGTNYLYIEGVVGLAKAMVDKEAVTMKGEDAAREISLIRLYMRLLFENILIDDVAVGDEALEKFLKDNSVVQLALHAILKFRPIEKIEGRKFTDYKIMVENALMAA